MKKLSVIFILIATIAFGADIPSQQIIAETNLFTNPNDYEINSVCKPTCRKVDNKYVALVVDFDPKSGVTFCNIYDRNNLDDSIGINANTTNLKCIKDTNIDIGYSGLWSNQKKYNSVSQLNYSPNNKTLTGFLAGLVTLDPSLIDYEKTQAIGMLELKDPTAIYGTNTEDMKINQEIISKADNFNKANLAYYSNLYSGMSKVYTALQYMLLVVVGGWFFTVLGVKEANNRFEKQQSQTKVLNTFLIPIVVLATFFMPIPEQSGMNGTIVQKAIRTSAIWSNNFADRIGTAGAEAYMQKLYSSVGAFSVEGEKILRENAKNISAIKSALYNGLMECRNRYPNVISFIKTNPEAEKLNLNQNSSEKYSFLGCQNIEHSWGSYLSIERQNTVMLKALERSLKNNELATVLNQINTSVNKRENELGWINSTIIPSMAILVEHLPLISENDIAIQMQKDNKKLEENIINDTSKSNYLDRKGREKEEEIDPDMVGNLVYFILPGAGEVYNALEGTASALIGFLNKIPLIGGLAHAWITKMAALTPTVILYKKILEYIPLTVSVIASALAFIGYIIELAKFFYITPFVTAFSFTTGKQGKITEFLVTGISIFVKPILIVLFIYFALFIYSLFKDIFMLYGIEQFAMVKELNGQFTLEVMVSIFKELFQILGTIGATYIMWKIILSAPAWVLKMVGINDSGAGGVTDQLSHKLERYSFQL